MTFRVRPAIWQEEGDALLAIRHAVFVDEQGVPPELEHDAADQRAFHLIAELADGTAVGTGRLLPDGHIGRMAVLPGQRGRGIGTRLLETLLAEARRRGLEQVALHAQVQAIPFYGRLGFTVEGDVFLDAGLEHRRMVMNPTHDPD